MLRSGLCILALCAFAGGCAARGDLELLETQLRNRENELRTAREELGAAREELLASQREIRLLQQNLADREAPALVPETARQLARITGIRFDETLTGALDRDNVAGDDFLNVVVAPHDAFDAVVRQEGTLEIELVDLALPEDRRVVASRTIDAADSSPLWHDGFLGRGFQIELPWDVPPQSTALALHARFTTPDGRTFDATQTVPVNVGEPAPLPATAAVPASELPEIRPLGFESPAKNAQKPPERIPLKSLAPPRK